jgi:hypothetical protein
MINVFVFKSHIYKDSSLLRGVSASEEVIRQVKIEYQRALNLVDIRNDLVSQEDQKIFPKDLWNKGSWFWLEELKDIQRYGITKEQKRDMDNWDYLLRLNEEKKLIEIEKRSFVFNVQSLCRIINKAPIKDLQDEEYCSAVKKFKEEKISKLLAWIHETTEGFFHEDDADDEVDDLVEMLNNL